MVERDDEVWLERALDDKRRSADVSSPPPGGFADVQLRRAQRRQQRRRELAIAFAASIATLAAVVAAGWWLWPDADDRTTARSTGPLAAGPGIAGPSSVQPPPGGTVTVVAEEDARVRELGDRIFAVDAGTVWFAVDPGSGRMEVRAPDRTVVVLGTVFAVRVEATNGAAGTTVGVLCGRVRVEAQGEDVVELAAGQQLPPRAIAALPLDTVWRARMTSLFPERAAREASVAVPSAAVVASLGPAEPAVPGPVQAGETDEVPESLPPAPGGVAQVPSTSPVASGSTTSPPASQSSAGVAPIAATGQGAVASSVPPAGGPPVVPPPIAGMRTDLRANPTWRDSYQQAWERLVSDPAGAAAAIDALIESAPTSADAEEAMLALASIYHDSLRHYARARTVYERYLERFPSGAHRRDVWMALCLAYGETGDADRQRLCLRAFSVEFP